MSAEEKVAIWEKMAVSEGEPSGHDSSGGDEAGIDIPEDDELELADLEKYRHILIESSPYRWLVSSIHRESAMAVAGPNLASAIRGQIVQKLGRLRTISLKAPPELSRVAFKVPLDLPAIFEEQQYDVSAAEALPKVITLTGHGDNVQAVTCLDYMTQIWPQTGPAIIYLCQQLLDDRTEDSTG
jgi:hypothetical protein